MRLILVLLLALPSYGQILAPIFQAPPASGPHSDTYTWNSAANGALDTTFWTDVSGGFGTASVAGTSPNKYVAGGFTFDTTGATKWATTSWTYNADQTSEIGVTNMASSGTLNITAAMCRVTSSGSTINNYQAVVVDDAASGSAHTVKLQKVVSGTITNLVTAQTITWTNGDKIGVDCRGTTITALKNGVATGSPTMTATDSSVSSGQPGFITHNGGAGAGGITAGGTWHASE